MGQSFSEKKKDNSPTPNEQLILLESLNQFRETFSNLAHSTYAEKKQKIEEMNAMINSLNDDELESIVKSKLFDIVAQMIGKEQLSLEMVNPLICNIGYWKTIVDKKEPLFPFSSKLINDYMKIIIYEESIKNKNNEETLICYCECFLLNSSCYYAGDGVLYFCICHLLKAALNKGESEKEKKEVEKSLLALTRTKMFSFVEKEFYLTEITEIIKYHQQARNLTHLAYQCAWEFFFDRIYFLDVQKIYMTELQFAKETLLEIGELERTVDWKKDKEKLAQKKEALIIRRWLKMIDTRFQLCGLWKEEELVQLLACVAKLNKASKKYHRRIKDHCSAIIEKIINEATFRENHSLKLRVFDFFSEKMLQAKLEIEIVAYGLQFFSLLTKNMCIKTSSEKDKATIKKMKREIYELTEEKGYEDIILIITNQKIFKYCNVRFSRNLCDYLICF